MSSGAVAALVVSLVAFGAPSMAHADEGDTPPVAASPSDPAPPADTEQPVIPDPDPTATPTPEPTATPSPEPTVVPDPPVNVTLPSISGVARVGSTLTAHPGSWGGRPALTYQWLANGARITGATRATLALGSGYKNKTITLAVTGTKKGYDPVSAVSTPTAKVGSGVLQVAAPTITGTLASGSTLTAKPGTWTRATAFTYQWYAGGKAIGKATKPTYKLTSAQVGKRITVKVTGTKTDYVTAAKTSAASPKVAKAATPLISGVKKKGQTLSAKPGTWTKGTKFSYQWLADGKTISKATRSTLKLTSALAAKSITVRVTGTKTGYATVAKTSGPVGRWPGRWIEIDLSKQRMYLHENGKVVASHLVSTGKSSTPTHTGTYRVRAKVRIQNMGCTPRFDYCTKDVPWVMYFNGDQAVHGAYWHNNFGRVMSHGCVNLPVKTAKRVFEWSKVGTIVWVHP